jgi:hypothetical protein
MISSHEFARMLTESDMPEHLATAFEDEPVATVALRYLHFMAIRTNELERMLEKHRREQESIFERLYSRRHFRRRIEPMVAAYRQQNTRGTRYHPYSHSPSRISTPSDDDSEEPPSSDEEIRLMRPIHDPSPTSSHPKRCSNDSSSTSFHTATDGELDRNSNPIVVEDGEHVGPTPQLFCLQCNETEEDAGRYNKKRLNDQASLADDDEL